MRPLMAIALLGLLTASLAGCADDPERYPDGVPTPSSTSRAQTTSAAPTSTSSSSSTSTGPAPNQAPTGSIAVALNGTNATFTLNATDPDGDALVWDLDFGDGNATNGTSLPTVLNHTYVVNGTANLTATFTVTDGVDRMTYNATLGFGGGAATLFAFTQATSAPGNPAMSTVVPTPLGGFGPGANACTSFNTDTSGGDCVFTPLDASLVGKAFTGTATAGEADLEFWDSCDAALGLFVEDFYNEGPEAGIVPEGAGCVILWDGGFPPAAPGFPTFTFTVTG